MEVTDLDEFTQVIVESCDDLMQEELLEYLQQGYSIEEAVEMLSEE